MIRSKLCSKTSCDLVKSCLCRVDHEAAARDVIKLLLTEPDHSDVRRTRKMTSQLSLQCRIGLYQSPASESFIIYGCQGNSVMYQLGIDMTQQQRSQENICKSTINTNKPTIVQLSIVLLKLREQVSELPVIFAIFLLLQLPSFFNGHHDFNLYSSDVCFEYSPVAKQSPLVTVGKQQYKIIVETFRYITCCVWAVPKLEVMKINKVIDNGTIECRWRVSGQLRGRFGKGKDR